MAGGLINIVAYGSKDLYLTGSPQITFFKIVYRRYTNFSKESYIIELGDINFGDEITKDIPKIADLCGQTFLRLELPPINFLKTDICTNLSTDEISILNNVIPPGIIVDEILDTELSIITDLLNTYKFSIIDIISQFCQAYRKSVLEKNTITQTTTDYINSIKEAILISNEDIDLYNQFLNDTLEYEHNLGNTIYDAILTPEFSNVGQIINEITPDATITSISRHIYDAIQNCVEVSKYYFNLLKKQKSILDNKNSKYAKFAWIDKVGHGIINRIDTNIGGERIDRHYGDWINLWYELTTDVHQDELYNKMIGNLHEFKQFDRNPKNACIVNIPLSFWFCKKWGLAFPLIALQYSNISLTIQLNTFEKCAYIEKFPRYRYTSDGVDDWLEINQLSLTDIWDNMGLKINGSLLIEYIFLDTTERRRFAQSAHEYLIEVVDQMNIESVTNSKNIITLDFNGPCKELFWVAQRTEYINDDSFLKKMPFNYSLGIDGKGNPITNSKLLLNGFVRFDNLDEIFFNYLQPNVHHTKSPSDGVNVYSFSLFSQDHQPSGTCNFSKIGDPTLVFIINKSMFTYNLSDVDPNIIVNSDNDMVLSTSVDIRIYSVRYQILRIIGGSAGFAYNYVG
jgi:hypothetical protein